MAKKIYDWKITLRKAVTVAIEVMIAGLLVYITENPAWLGLAPVLEALRNWLKNRNL